MQVQPKSSLVKQACITFAIALVTMACCTLLFTDHAFAADGEQAQGNATLLAGSISEIGTMGTTATAANQTAPQKVSISKCKITMKKSMKYTALSLKPRPKVSYKGKKLHRGRDYKLRYKNNRAIGTAYVYITGKGKYKGTVKKRFKIKYSNVAIAVAACRLSYSRPRTDGHSVNRSNGYWGTPTYLKYTPNRRGLSCTRVVWMAINSYLGVDKTIREGVGSARSHMKNSKNWRRVGTYKKGMENDANTKLRPGDIYNSGRHTCIYVGKDVPRIVYKQYLKADSKTKKKLGKRNPDLGRPTKNSMWVSSHAEYMGGSPAHICERKDALPSTGGAIFRYVGKGNNDPNRVTK